MAQTRQCQAYGSGSPTWRKSVRYFLSCKNLNKFEGRVVLKSCVLSFVFAPPSQQHSCEAISVLGRSGAEMLTFQKDTSAIRAREGQKQPAGKIHVNHGISTFVDMGTALDAGPSVPAFFGVSILGSSAFLERRQNLLFRLNHHNHCLSCFG